MRILDFGLRTERGSAEMAKPEGRAAPVPRRGGAASIWDFPVLARGKFPARVHREGDTRAIRHTADSSSRSPRAKRRTSIANPKSKIQNSTRLKRSIIAITTFLVLAAFSAPATIAAPQVATVAQVGEPASPGTHYVFIYLRFIDGAEPHPAYAIYHKPGLADSPAPYERLAVIRPTAHIPTIAALMERASDAGFDNVALEMLLDDILPSGPYETLAEKVAAFLMAEPEGIFAHQKVVVAAFHPQTAMPLGQAYVARVPDGGPNTFEVREFDPLTDTSGPVVGRVTTPAAPAVLPPPGDLSELVEATPRGHLRVHLRWCLPQPLGEMGLHWSGFQMFRVPHGTWQQAFGVDPPVDLTRDELLDAVAMELAVPVNEFPIAPGEELPCPVPAGSEVFFMTDDNDSTQQMAFETGGESFEDGFEATYFVAAVDHFGRIGDPSPGLPVLICDRLPPLSPSRVRVDNVYKQEGADDHALHISWHRDDPGEVVQYHVFRYENPDDVFEDRQSPIWPATANRIAVVENTGTGDRLRFTDTTPGSLSLPGDDGLTRWFSIVAEDGTSCPGPLGYGNLSGPSGPVPGALYNLAGPGEPAGRLRVPCCDIVAQQGELGTFHRDEPLVLLAERLDKKIAWVEFRDAPSDTYLGRFHFGMDDLVVATPAFQGGDAVFQARFGTAYDHTSNWVGSHTVSGPPYPEHNWSARWNCRPSTRIDCPDGVVDPVDPETGDFINTCVELIDPPPEVVSVALYRRIGDNGPLVLLRREEMDTNGDGVNDLTELCEPSPPANPGLVCYYLQYFDRNGNPSVVARVDCVQTRGTEDFPVPRITHFFAENNEGAFFPITGVPLAWFCPRPGVDRFEVAVTPPPPGVETTFQGGHEAGVGPIWGVVESERLAAGFGEDSPNFATTLILERGKNYQAKVRAVGEGIYGERDAGAWSDEETLLWLLDPEAHPDPPDEDCPMPWPARDVAPLITDPARELEARLVDWADPINGTIQPVTELWIKVAEFERDELIRESEPGQSVPVPPRVITDDLREKLLVPLAFTVYLHQTSENSRGTMLQVSHYVDEILKTDAPEPGQIDIIDRAFALAGFEEPDDDGNEGPAGLWFRVRQPLIADRTYRCAVVLHGGDREPMETLRTEEITVSPWP